MNDNELEVATRRVARTMGMEEQEGRFKLPEDGGWYTGYELTKYNDPVAWWFYGIVSGHMHRIGWSKRVITDATDGIGVEFWKRDRRGPLGERNSSGFIEGYHEPRLAVEAAYHALIADGAIVSL